PYSGLEFRYYPVGVADSLIPTVEPPEGSNEHPKRFLVTENGADILPGQSGIWCTSPVLITNIALSEEENSVDNQQAQVITLTYSDSWDQPRFTPQPEKYVLGRGTWFAIPDAPAQ